MKKHQIQILLALSMAFQVVSIYGQEISKIGVFQGGNELNDFCWDYNSSSIFIASYFSNDSIDVSPTIGDVFKDGYNPGSGIAHTAIIQCDSNFSYINHWMFDDTSHVVVYSLNNYYGKLWLTGYVYDQGNLDPKAGQFPVKSDSYNPPATSNQIGFIAKYTNSMDFEGAYLFGNATGFSAVEPWELVSDGVGGLYCSGLIYSDSVNFPSASGNSWIYKNGSYNSFVLGIDTAMNFNWVNKMDGKVQIWTMAVVDSNLFLGGVAQGTNGFLGNNATSNGSFDISLTKLNLDGTFGGFHTNIGGAGGDLLYSINGTSDNKLLLAGRFNQQVEFNPLGSAAFFKYASDNDGFIAKYDKSGITNWVETYPAAGNNSVISAVQISSDEILSLHNIADVISFNGDTIYGGWNAGLAVFTHNLSGQAQNLIGIDSIGCFGSIQPIPGGAIIRSWLNNNFEYELPNGTTVSPSQEELVVSPQILLKIGGFNGVGIRKLANPKIKAFPNPNRGIFTLEVDGTYLGSEYELTDELGRLIEKGKVETALQYFDLSGKPKGIYRLSIKSTNGIKTMAVVVQ